MAAIDNDQSVKPLPLSRARATAIIKEIAADSSRWAIMIDYSDKQKWRNSVNRRQIGLCLSEGYILEDRTKVDKHGRFRFRIARVCAGLDVVIHVALESNGVLPTLAVLAIDGDHIQI